VVSIQVANLLELLAKPANGQELRTKASVASVQKNRKGGTLVNVISRGDDVGGAIAVEIRINTAWVAADV
jgi:hypothetical protein